MASRLFYSQGSGISRCLVNIDGVNESSYRDTQNNAFLNRYKFVGILYGMRL